MKDATDDEASSTGKVVSPLRVGPRVTIPRLPALDGLRGLAVLGVLLFHANGALRGGYLGVDLFFVLSGFLITSILIAEHRETGRIDLRVFWIRRARRLFPALLSLMPAIAVYAWRFAQPNELAGLRADGLATLAYVANWRSIFAHRSYWELFAAPSPLEHTWSLAIEEQFYVLWPLLVVAVFTLAGGSKVDLAAKRGTRALAVASGVLALGSATAMTWLYVPEDTTRVYLGTDTRGAAILAGAMLASVLAESAPTRDVRMIRVLDLFGLVAAAGLGAAWALVDGQSPFLYRGGFWLTELAAVVLITCAAQGRESLIARGLAVRPLRVVGAISYGVYLWHWPLYIVLTTERTHLAGVRLTLVRFAATFVVAAVSYRWFEQPIRHRGIFFGKAIVVVPSAVALAVALLVVSTVGGAAPLPPAALPVPIVPVASAPRADASTDVAELPLPSVRDLRDAAELPPGTLRVLVLGDSVAMSLGNLLRVQQAQSGTFVAQRGVGDCSLLDGVVPTRTISNQSHGGGNCAQDWASDTEALHPDVTLVLFGGGYFASAKIDGVWQHPCDRGWHDVYVKQMASRLSGLLRHGGRPMLLLPPYPVGKWEYLNPRVDCFDAALRDAASAVPGVVTLDLQARLCPGGACELTSEGAPIRIDGLHFEYPGGVALANWVLTSLPRDMLRDP